MAPRSPTPTSLVQSEIEDVAYIGEWSHANQNQGMDLRGAVVAHGAVSTRKVCILAML